MVTTLVKKTDRIRRIIRKHGKVTGIIEEKDATAAQKKIKEINSGIYCFNWKKLDWALSKIKKNKLKGEYYLTDTIALFKKRGYSIGSYKVKDPAEVMGIDNIERLKEAERFLRRK